MNCPVVTGPRQVTHLNDVGSFPGPFGLYRKVLVIISPCGAFPSADIKQVSALQMIKKFVKWVNKRMFPAVASFQNSYQFSFPCIHFPHLTTDSIHCPAFFVCLTSQNCCFSYSSLLPFVFISDIIIAAIHFPCGSTLFIPLMPKRSLEVPPSLSAHICLLEFTVVFLYSWFLSPFQISKLLGRHPP